MSKAEIITVGNTSFVRFEANVMHNLSNTVQISLDTSSKYPSIDFHYQSPATKKCALTGSQTIIDKIDRHKCTSVQECQDKYNSLLEAMRKRY